MKYGKVISIYRNELIKNKLLNLDKVLLVSIVVLDYKKLKQLIKTINTSKEYSYEKCCICLDNLGIDYVTLNCSHCYHIECVIKLFKCSNNCALCRKHFPDLIYMNNSEKNLINFIAFIMMSINKIEFMHFNLKNIIKNRSNSSNFLWICWNRDTNKLIKYLKKFDEINSKGIIKIIKKFTKKTKIELQYIIDYCKTLDFFIYK